MGNLEDKFKDLIISPPDPPEKPTGRPRLYHPDRASTGTERKKKTREKKSEQRKRCIAVLDTETDPFDNVSREFIFPFLAVLYSRNFEPIIIWEENHDKFIDAIISAIEALPDAYTIYAHNGGKFDFLFLIHRLRGDVKFKGRGIMCARIGAHELRDSFHVIPEKLASYQKDVFDYKMLHRSVRSNHRAEIVRYCLHDCAYLLDIVEKFIGEFGLKLSIGQAAMSRIIEHYDDIQKFSKGWDTYVRQFYFGGRVECIQGAGLFKGPFKLIDTNSMYPDVMARYEHPIGGFADYEIHGGPISENTIFIELYCENRGALIARDPDTGETTARIRRGVFKTTIWEFNVAIKHGLISNIQIISCLDCAKRTNFKKFVIPLYENRLVTKASLAELKALKQDTGAAYMDLKKDDIFYKLLLNNGYGKFCQDPTRYKEHYITDPEGSPPEEWWKSVYDLGYPECDAYIQPIFESDRYWIWCKPSPGFRYNNVGTGASITGAARSVLLDAIQLCENPIYCDTDSIICTGWDERQLRTHKTELGAWDLEDEFTQVAIDGKKLYSVWHKEPKRRSPEELERGLDPCYTIKSKGTAGMTWIDMLGMLEGKSVFSLNSGPTLTKTGKQTYIGRNMKRTAPIYEGTRYDYTN